MCAYQIITGLVPPSPASHMDCEALAIISWKLSVLKWTSIVECLEELYMKVYKQILSLHLVIITLMLYNSSVT